MIARLLQLQRDGGRAVVLTVVEGEGLGSKLLVVEGGETVGDGPPELAAHAEELIRGARSRTVELEGRTVFAEVYGPPPRLFVYGAVDTAEALAAGARLLGWRTIVADARAKFATGERIRAGRADRGLARGGVRAVRAGPCDRDRDPDPRRQFDLPALELALATDAFYVGLIGGRRNQERKRERLRERGVTEEAIERISGPCGLDVGADSVPETALSILAEALAARNGRAGGPLSSSTQRIHA